MHPLRIAWIFYRNFYLITLLITVVCCYTLFMQHSLALLTAFIFLKLFSDLFAALIWLMLRSHELYFYYNLGWNKRELFISALFIDTFLFIAAILLTTMLI